MVDDAGVVQYRQIQNLIGTKRSVVVQPRIYGTDNSATLNAVAELGARDTRGIAVVDSNVDDATLRMLHEGGIRGIRFSFHAPNSQAGGFDTILPLAERVKEVGWHVQLHWTADQIAEHRDVLFKMPVPIVFDHLARIPIIDGHQHAAVHVVHNLLADGRAWVKLSGAYLNTHHSVKSGYGDTDIVARTWIEAAPDRLIWGSDWPHVTEPELKPDDAELFDLLSRWCVSDVLRRRILVENPMTLYGFDRA